MAPTSWPESVGESGDKPTPAPATPGAADNDEKQAQMSPCAIETDEERTPSTTPPLDPYDEPYPEGGLRAWLVVFGAWCGLTACFGMANTVGAFQAYFVQGPLRDYREGDIAWIFGAFIFLGFFCGIVCGPVFDTYGPRWLLLAGSIMMVASMIVLSWCTGECRKGTPACDLNNS